MTSKILVDIPMNWVTTYLLEDGKTYLVGNGSAAAIRIPDPRVEPKHAEIQQKGESWTIRDLGTPVGVFVNNQKVQEFPLADGDVIRMGRIEIVYQCPAHRATEEAWQRTQQLVEQRQAALSNALKHRTSPDSPGAVDLEKAMAPAASKDPNESGMQSIKPIISRDLDSDDLVWVAKELLEILKDVLEHPGGADEVYKHMLARLKRSIGADNGFVMIPDEQRNRWVIRAWTGDPNDWTAYEKQHPVPLTVANRAFETSRLVSNAMDIAGDDSVEIVSPEESRSMQLMNVQCYVAVPLIRGGKRRGVLYFDTRKTIKMFEPREVRLLQQAGNYILEIERQRATA